MRIRKNTIFKQVIMSLLMIVTLASYMTTLAVSGTIDVPDVTLVDKGWCGDFVTYKGSLIRAALVVYNKNGIEYPAYCLEADLDGVGTEGIPTGEYDIVSLLENDRLWRVITNGYPYKTPSQMGLSSPQEAFFATKQAVYRSIDNKGMDDYEAVNSAGERVLKVMKELYDIGLNGTETRETPLITAKSETSQAEVDKLDSRYKSQVFSINANYNLNSYEVSFLPSKAPVGTKITDVNGVEKTEFDANEKFKVMIPVNENEITSFDIVITANLESKPVFYAESKNVRLQTVAITSDPYEETKSEATVTLGNIKADIEIQKRDRVTNKGLANAVFEVRKVNGEIIGTYVTDSTGSVKLQVTESGYYQIEECEPPENYLLSEENIKTILVEFEKENSITFLNDKKAGLEIIKVDKDTGKVLANARYRITNTDGSIVGEYTTNNMGTINIQDLMPGWYEVLEISAPTNYLRDENIHKILIKENEVTTLTLTNKELQGIQIIKKDSVTEKTLANATFSIKEVGGSLVGEYTTNEMGVIEIQHLKPAFYELKELSAPRGYLIDTETKIVEVTSKESVVVEFFNTAKGGLQIKKVDEKTGEPLANAKFRVTTITGQTLGEYTTSRTGFINLPELEDGWYIVEEVLAPDNYILDNTPKTVEVRGDKPTIVEFTNREKGGIQILKVDAATGVPLEGAKFRVTTKNGLLIGEYTTDRQGHINLSGLENGWYTILEVEAPKNYILDDVKRDVEVKGDKNQIVEFTNRAKAGLQILKIDFNTGKPLADAKFRVSKMDGKIIGEYVTSRTGYINIGDLDEGWYLVEEILAPEGYALNTTPQTVKVESNKNQILEFANKQLAGIEIIKFDEYTKTPLKGAKFKVTTKNGDFIGEYETDVVGKITIPNLDAGWYSIQEVLAPKEYILDSTIKDVQVTYYENAIVEFTNRAKAGLQILKKDSVTKQGLKDVKFKVSKINGELIGTFITDASGMIYLSSLNEGWYIIQEVSTQNGYKIDTTPRNVEVKSNVATVIEFENIPYSTLIIEKIDGVTTKPIAGVKFNIRKENGEYIGDFTTDYFGQIKLNKTLDADTYIINEITPVENYKQDTTTYKVTLGEGETELLQVKNFPYGSLKVIKYDNKTKERLEGVKYKLEDEKGNLVGIYKTNENGEILIEKKLEAGVFYLLELSSLDSYVTDTEKHRIEISWGKTTIIELGNTEITGRIQIVKTSADNNEYTGLLAGSPLSNAKFEIRNEEGELVDTITTSYDGKAISKRLSFGKYIVKELLSPKYYLKDEKEYVVEIDENDEIEILAISNESIKLNVTVDKTGIKETQCLDEIRYDFTNIRNNSNTSLDNFIWHDSLPIETKLQKIYTGTWNENLIYKVSYKTNLNSNYKVFRDNLFTNQNYELDFTTINLQIDEYITDYIFEFGTVKAGFSQVESPFIFVKVNKYLKDGREFVNFTEVKGYYNEILVSATDSWKTIIYNKTIKPVKYPKTGE